jgi:hypothetical protein
LPDKLICFNKISLEIEALNKAKLPKIDLNAQATYQSDVTATN